MKFYLFFIFVNTDVISYFSGTRVWCPYWIEFNRHTVQSNGCCTRFVFIFYFKTNFVSGIYIWTKTNKILRETIFQQWRKCIFILFSWFSPNIHYEKHCMKIWVFTTVEVFVFSLTLSQFRSLIRKYFIYFIPILVRSFFQKFFTYIFKNI